MNNLNYKKEELKTLVKLSQENDIKALEELIRRIQKNVFGLFSYMVHSRQDVSDLTQEALLKMAKCINTLKDTNCFKSWMNHIVMNTFYDYTRSHTKDNTIDISIDKLLEVRDRIGCEPGEKCLFAELDEIIKAALLSLPQNLRIAIILREYEGLSYEDISKLTDTAIGTVKSRIARARFKLQRQLKEFI